LPGVFANLLIISSQFQGFEVDVHYQQGKTSTDASQESKNEIGTLCTELDLISIIGRVSKVLLKWFRKTKSAVYSEIM